MHVQKITSGILEEFLMPFVLSKYLASFIYGMLLNILSARIPDS